jgi:ethanolaminephosphotransferase
MALRTVLLTIANLVIPVAILIFATGFFPYKPFMPGLAEYERLGWEETMGWKEGSIPKAPFDKLVFMVVDALRSDFVFGEESGMNFVQRYDAPIPQGMDVSDPVEPYSCDAV